MHALPDYTPSPLMVGEKRAGTLLSSRALVNSVMISVGSLETMRAQAIAAVPRSS